jgi:hypothetical protein
MGKKHPVYIMAAGLLPGAAIIFWGENCLGRLTFLFLSGIMASYCYIDDDPPEIMLIK